MYTWLMITATIASERERRMVGSGLHVLLRVSKLSAESRDPEFQPPQTYRRAPITAATYNKRASDIGGKVRQMARNGSKQDRFGVGRPMTE